ncbi:MAG: alpha/beta hydrolase [Chitinophagaceae bacterium]|nr:alpha/beta hydrolase [Chitinophagaceae bacterium]
MKPLIFLLLLGHAAAAQEIIPLYNDSIPNSTGYKMQERVMGPAGDPDWLMKTSVPALTAFIPSPEKSTGAAVLIFPGGGYTGLSYKAEGIDVAKEFLKHGIAAFVVKYRLPSDSIMKDKSIGPLQDAQQAMKYVREKAQQYKITKIGIIGFSAGGHLASTLGTHFTKAFIRNDENVSLRPDFMMLIYPVITMRDSLAHKGSRGSLLGDHPSDSVLHYFSNDEEVTDSTPPTYITHTQDDKVVDVENSILFYQALRRHHIFAEMHLYPRGDHGFVLNLPISDWMEPVFAWIKTQIR